MEEWKDIEGYEGLYQVSNTGKVKSLHYRGTDKQEILTPINNSHNRLQINLYGREKSFPSIHVLVAQHFIPNPENKPIVHHIDHNPLNNNVNNLMWVTEEEHKALHPEVFEASVVKKSIPIMQYTLDGQFVKEYPSAREVERQTNIHNAHITACCKGKQKTAGGFKWQYK